MAFSLFEYSLSSISMSTAEIGTRTNYSFNSSTEALISHDQPSHLNMQKSTTEFKDVWIQGYILHVSLSGHRLPPPPFLILTKSTPGTSHLLPRSILRKGLLTFGERWGDKGMAKRTEAQLPLKQNWPSSKRCTTFWLGLSLCFSKMVRSKSEKKDIVSVKN